MLVKLFRSSPKLAATVLAVYPILGLVFCVYLFAKPPSDAESAQVAAQQSTGGPPVLVILILLLIVASKITAVVGLYRRWYLGWVFHILELNLVIFIQGLFLVIAVLSMDFALQSAVKLILMMACLYISVLLKMFWRGRDITDRYQVTSYTHA
ncbi:MAG: hypothetical protein K6L76_14350 [Agarilytica sp.]